MDGIFKECRATMLRRIYFVRTKITNFTKSFKNHNLNESIIKV